MQSEQTPPFRGLPPPSPAALQQSRQLTDRIADRIVDEGPLNFADYMQMALYEPELGYYTGASRKFGAEGDFITAPELSPLFAACLARPIRQLMPLFNHPCILEAGPGSGRLASELLACLQAQQSLPAHYYLLEISRELQQRQRALLEKNHPDLRERLRWLAAPPVEPYTGIVIANEILDALPVRRISNSGGHWQEIYVDFRQQQFVEILQPLDAGMQALVASRLPPAGDLPAGYVTEISPALDAWLQQLVTNLEQGLLLFIDYGYGRNEFYHPQRVSGSLLCHYRHHVHSDAFFLPGLQDITASVDFTALAEAALAAGLQVSGYTTQAHFLIAAGLETVMQEAAPKDAVARAELARQVKILTLPGEMGEHIKVMALTKNLDLPVDGFRQADMRQRL